MTFTPSEVGSRAELEVASALVRSGRRVYVPLLAADGRVDMIYEDPARGLQRVQCKTARMSRGVISFKVCSNTKNLPRDYRGEIDVFGVFSPDLAQVFIVPVEDVAGLSAGGPSTRAGLTHPRRYDRSPHGRWVRGASNRGEVATALAR